MTSVLSRGAEDTEGYGDPGRERSSMATSQGASQGPPGAGESNRFLPGALGRKAGPADTLTVDFCLQICQRVNFA